MEFGELWEQEQAAKILPFDLARSKEKCNGKRDVMDSRKHS